MASSFYECSGTVTAFVSDPSALLCSSAWLAVSEPTFTLVTQEVDECAIAIASVEASAYVFLALGLVAGFIFRSFWL